MEHPFYSIGATVRNGYAQCVFRTGWAYIWPQNGRKRRKAERRDTLTPKKEKALAALLTHSTRKEAAAAAGVSVRTMQDYFRDPEFLDRYNRAFADVVQDATRAAQQILQPALSTLKEIMGDTDIAPAARVQACRTALEYAGRLTEQNDILSRLAALEAQADKEAL